MKNIIAAMALAIFCTACASDSTDNWYTAKLKDQDRKDSTLNAPTPDRADRDKFHSILR